VQKRYFRDNYGYVQVVFCDGIDPEMGFGRAKMRKGEFFSTFFEKIPEKACRNRDIRIQ
jgi:hypothetical protein